MRKEKIKKLVAKGYHLQEEKFDNGVRFYSCDKKEKDNTTTTVFEIGIRDGKWLAKKFGFRIKKAEKTTVALNFIPEFVSKGKIRTFYFKV